MTTVSGIRRRTVGPDTFADLTSVPVAVGGITLTGITFDGDLTPGEVSAVWARMESRDDADQADRATLRAAGDATNLAQILAAYVTGDPLPTPILPA